MTILEEELTIIEKYKEEIENQDSREEIKRIYGQARLWNRIHFFYGKGCSRERYEELNNIFKMIRREKISTMGV